MSKSSRPRHLLSQRQWLALVRVAEREPHGLPVSALRPKVYLELNGRRRHHFIETIWNEQLGGSAFVLTPAGFRHIRDMHPVYYVLYPYVRFRLPLDQEGRPLFAITHGILQPQQSFPRPLQ